MKSQLFRAFAGVLCLFAAPAVSARQGTVAAASASKPQRVVVATASPRSVERVITRINSTEAATEGVSPDVLNMALSAVACATAAGDIQAPPTLTLIDYSRPSVQPRLWVFNMTTGKLLFKELVAHGKNTGENMAVHFSDDLNSRQSSLGLFVAADTYVGSNGYSLRLDGLEPGFNAHARERAIVMHGAPYVDTGIAASNGRLGRSWGCPALREAVAHNVIDTIRGGGVIFSYYPDQTWLHSSRFLNCSQQAGVRAQASGLKAAGSGPRA